MSAFCRAANVLWAGLAADSARFVSPTHAVSSFDLRALRAFGADDGKSPGTPSAWMISMAPSLALRQGVFFVWVSLSEQKWVILAERRGRALPLAALVAHGVPR